MACNDIRGRQVIEACLQAGLRVPDDVAVVGVDEDRLLCELANPPLSSVVLNLEAGRLSGGRTARRIDVGPHPESRNESWSRPCGSSRGVRPTWWPSKTGTWRRPRDSFATTSARPSRWTTWWPKPASRARSLEIRFQHSPGPFDPPGNPAGAAGLEQEAAGGNEPLGRKDRPTLRLQQSELHEQRLSA